MTGFGSGKRERDGILVSVELRSVNHRFLKTSVHLAEDLGWVQSLVETRLRERIERGSVGATLQIERSSRAGAVAVDAALLRKLHAEVEEVRRALKIESPVALGDLLAVEGVVRASEAALRDAPAVRVLVEEAVDEALAALQAMQEREGGFLRQEIDALLTSVEVRMLEISKRMPDVARLNRERYLAKLRDFVAGTGIELAHADLVREVALLAEKADVTEEVGRLRGHVIQYREAVEEGGRIGRKLDFLTQEMFREANTMAAKVTEYDLARAVVDVKADVDRLREQTQNIE